VVPQLLYDAAKMLQKAESEPVRAKGKPTLSRSHRYVDAHSAQLGVRLQSLRVKAREEEEANENLIKSHGETSETRVQFRDTIQLRHLPSKKFLSLVPRITADLDPECMKIELTGGSDATIFRVQLRCEMSLHIGISESITFLDRIQLSRTSFCHARFWGRAVAKCPKLPRAHWIRPLTWRLKMRIEIRSHCTTLIYLDISIPLPYLNFGALCVMLLGNWFFRLIHVAFITSQEIVATRQVIWSRRVIFDKFDKILWTLADYEWCAAAPGL